MNTAFVFACARPWSGEIENTLLVQTIFNLLLLLYWIFIMPKVCTELYIMRADCTVSVQEELEGPACWSLKLKGRVK